MKSKFLITLIDSETEESLLAEEEFITFEEAVVCANLTRNKLGTNWKTVSIVNVSKKVKHVTTTK